MRILRIKLCTGLYNSTIVSTRRYNLSAEVISLNRRSNEALMNEYRTNDVSLLGRSCTVPSKKKLSFNPPPPHTQNGQNFESRINIVIKNSKGGAYMVCNDRQPNKPMGSKQAQLRQCVN